MYQKIEFLSQGITLRGRLYVPKNNKNKPPIVIMAHGFTTTINEMTADKYAERFRKVGYAVLLYDHRNLGVSDGEPRQEINFWVQSRGYIDAIDFVYTQSRIDTSKVAIWGASMSAREVFLVGSIDERVSAIITIIPAFGDDYPAEDKDGSLYQFAKKTLLSDNILELPYSTTKQMTIVSHDQINTPSKLKELTAYRWFIEYGGRFGTNWKNIVSLSITEAPKQLHLGQCAPHLKAPILMIVAKNDEMQGASPKVTETIFKSINQSKEWVDISGGHFGLLYYPSQLFEKSSKAQINFLERQFNK
ncbi:alpha/beta fold hydrolase [Pontimicrobium sp. SW4]|uniref:Alpha/beta fold hydrolase n=1 Tax=Pontimicrobium sp. SW4 TaxID=3153519 RepID=A0AAU7BPQ4_9FLAO